MAKCKADRYIILRRDEDGASRAVLYGRGTVLEFGERIRSRGRGPTLVGFSWGVPGTLLSYRDAQRVLKRLRARRDRLQGDYSLTMHPVARNRYGAYAIRNREQF